MLCSIIRNRGAIDETNAVARQQQDFIMQKRSLIDEIGAAKPSRTGSAVLALFSTSTIRFVPPLSSAGPRPIASGEAACSVDCRAALAVGRVAGAARSGRSKRARQPEIRSTAAGRRSLRRATCAR
jgi:hypothetical protein